MTTPGPVTVGRIDSPHGVAGWLRIFSFTEHREAILEYPQWLLCRQGRWQEHALLDGRRHGRGLVARLAGISDREQARQWLHSAIALHRHSLPPPGPEEHYWHDLLGLAVCNREQRCLGRVVQLYRSQAHDLLVVCGTHRYLIPFVRGVHVLDVNTEQGQLRVDWPVEATSRMPPQSTSRTALEATPQRAR